MPQDPRADTPPSPEAGSPARLAWVLVVSLTLLAVALRAIDHLPGLLLDQPRGVQLFSSVDNVEREIGTRLLLPAYFPDTLAWPPARVLLAPGAARPTALVITERATGRTRLVICQNARGDDPIPERLLPQGTALQRVELEVGGSPATLSRMAARDGTEWSDLTWVTASRRVTLRLYGDDTDLARLARTMTRVRP
jgi:hypothetical protein